MDSPTAPKIEIAETSKRVGRNAERLMLAQGLSINALAAVLKAHGRPIPPMGLSRLLRGKRRIDVDDLVALALVLNVNPNYLLFTDDGEVSSYQLTPSTAAPADEVRDWALGRRAIGTAASKKAGESARDQLRFLMDADAVGARAVIRQAQYTELMEESGMRSAKGSDGDS